MFDLAYIMQLLKIKKKLQCTIIFSWFSWVNKIHFTNMYTGMMLLSEFVHLHIMQPSENFCGCILKDQHKYPNVWHNLFAES